MKIIVNNKKAFFDYFVISTYEAGLVLLGSEVKSIRLGHISLADSYISISKSGEMFVKNMYIKKFDFESSKIDEKRERKLLLNQNEIDKISAKIKEKGYTLIPLKVYFNEKSLIKLDMGLCKGKKLYDKKQSLKEKDIDLEVKREISKTKN